MRRGARQLKAYLDKFKTIKVAMPELKASMVTFTVKNGSDLQERYEHLMGAIKSLNQRRKDSLRKKASKSEWCKVFGDVGSFETTYSNKHGWHPHCHFIALHIDDIDQEKLSEEWKEIPGDSFILDVRPLGHPDDPAKDLVEVFKYNLKFSSLAPDKNYEAYKILYGRRMIVSHGFFWGVKVPEDVSELLEGLPFIELFYRWIPGAGYSYSDRLTFTDYQNRLG
jgi:hypothetical protein